MSISSIGSVCSGIEAASVAWTPLGLSFSWLSEIAPYQSKLLRMRYPDTPNLGDLTTIPQRILAKEIDTPDCICAGTPCQAFSLAGWKKGLEDERGNLTLRFVDIVNANDAVRRESNKEQCIVFWENVEAVLTDKTNAFGCLISSLAGFDSAIVKSKWPSAGVVYGPQRNVAWRVLDAKYFGVPQQRRRLYLIAGGTNFHPENILFERHRNELKPFPRFPLQFKKDGHQYEVFREYTDCLYSAYGTKWNGNAAATNGSLFVVQDSRIRRFSPLECERLMGFPYGYSYIEGAKKTNQYQSVGNSWVVPVVRWLGTRLINECEDLHLYSCTQATTLLHNDLKFLDFGAGIIHISSTMTINCSPIPENPMFHSLEEIISPTTDESIYLSPVACYGILRRKEERKTRINKRLEEILIKISSEMPLEEIEKRSRVQHRSAIYDRKSPNNVLAGYPMRQKLLLDLDKHSK